MSRRRIKRTPKSPTLLEQSSASLSKAVIGQKAYLQVYASTNNSDIDLYIAVKVTEVINDGDDIQVKVTPLNGIGVAQVAPGKLLMDLKGVKQHMAYEETCFEAREVYRAVTTAYTYQRKLTLFHEFVASLPAALHSEIVEEADSRGINFNKPSAESMKELIKIALRVKYELEPDEYLD